jgi:hypothetical protein
VSALNLRQAAAVSVFVLAIGMVAAAIGYLTAPDGPASAAAVQETQDGLRGVIQRLAGDSLTLTTDQGPVELQLSQATMIEALRPVRLTQVAPGDWLNAGAIPHSQTVFALLSLVFIPQDRVTPPR